MQGVPTVLIARTDADSATLLTSDIDPVDKAFCTGERTPEGFYKVRSGVEPCIARALAYAPYCDMIWMETSKPNMEQVCAQPASHRAVPRPTRQGPADVYSPGSFPRCPEEAAPWLASWMA